MQYAHPKHATRHTITTHVTPQHATTTPSSPPMHALITPNSPKFTPKARPTAPKPHPNRTQSAQVTPESHPINPQSAQVTPKSHPSHAQVTPQSHPKAPKSHPKAPMSRLGWRRLQWGREQGLLVQPSGQPRTSTGNEGGMGKPGTTSPNKPFFKV